MNNLAYGAGGAQGPNGSFGPNVRVTGYWDGDPNTDAGLGSFGPLRQYAGPGTYGTAAVDPSIIPYGSVIAVQRNGGTQYYVPLGSRSS